MIEDTVVPEVFTTGPPLNISRIFGEVTVRPGPTASDPLTVLRLSHLFFSNKPSDVFFCDAGFHRQDELASKIVQLVHRCRVVCSLFFHGANALRDRLEFNVMDHDVHLSNSPRIFCNVWSIVVAARHTLFWELYGGGTP